ncbi:bromodomain-containing protein 8 isoform X6 [Scomber scombrus]|uniref:Bromodomain-containing protein 8 n=1 Tax=Scomber scombrus TaxID=13677 RepID=A0AAV1N3D8_SCOSC
MANGVGKHKLLVIGPTEPWSLREKLCLATSVMKSGDQNWVSVSRAIKPFAEPGRPPDWFSQKHCASKYSELLETTEAPKRKRGEKGEVVETVEDVIVRRLTAERIDELKKLIKETQEKHRKLKRESELIQAGHLDSKLEELWEEILQKKRLEEEESELKRKTTDAAYQARQVAKNTPKRVPGVTMHSPSDCSSPGQEFPPGDPLECLTLDHVSAKNASGSARLMSFAESPGSGSDDISHGSLLDDPTQKKLLGQKGTPPPSPLLSELLKKGSILATNSRLIGESDGSTGSMTGAHDLQLAPPCQPLSQATGAPMLSRLLEAGPTQFSAQLGFMVSPDSASSAPLSAATPVPADSTASACTEVDVMVPSVPTGCQPASAGDKASELSEEDVTVSYMGDELDLKTVGDIIAIIEDKEMRAEDGVRVGRGENASGTKVDNEVNGPEVCGEEDGDGVEGFLSEADGETELEPAASESEDGYSLHTASSSLQLHTTADSIPSSPASSQFSVCSEDLEALQAHKIWKKAIMLVWRAAANHRYANVFLQPVTDEIAPGYHSIVHRPMDLATIKKNIETGLIRTTAEFQRDIMLMFQNAVMYNSLDHDVYHMALEMQRDVLEQIQQFLATQLIMETSESGISAKSLRGRESTRKQDSTDKDGGTRGRRCAIEADLKMKK